MLIHPQFNPVAVQIGPLAIHWYGLMYLLAFSQFWWLGRRRIRTHPQLIHGGWTVAQLDDLLFYGVLGVILGGRLGEVLFYAPGYYFSHPSEMLAVWKGGMSFHGGFLGVLVELKGIFELLEAMHILKQRGVNIRCLVAGENARQLSRWKAWLLAKFGFGRDVRAELEALIKRHGLRQHVELLGFVADVRTLYPQLDILCFPSHLNAAGRPVFEAAFYGIPSVVAVRDPVADAVIHEVTGLAIAEPQPPLIADALQRLVEDPELRGRLGAQARGWAKQTFTIESNAARMAELYQAIVSRAARR